MPLSAYLHYRKPAAKPDALYCGAGFPSGRSFEYIKAGTLGIGIMGEPPPGASAGIEKHVPLT
jgi:hypothetical protein